MAGMNHPCLGGGYAWSRQYSGAVSGNVSFHVPPHTNGIVDPNSSTFDVAVQPSVQSQPLGPVVNYSVPSSCGAVPVECLSQHTHH